MRKMTSNEIRETWLNFWKSKGHMIEPSASLIPNNDPTLLWINAGVAALKKYFDGSEVPSNRRISNIQKCLRTNDIDNVGMTARHHTFFEMLGNFSIGDYFRNEAVSWGFELLTSKEYFDIPVEKLYFTVHPNDEETKKLWISLGVPSSHIVPVEGNFWEIGEGPCGPDTEIFFDRGEKYDAENIGVRLISDDIENDRYIEIWNIVFSQFNSKPGLDRKDYPELPNKNIDTGGGLERFACIMQEAETNFQTDLFMPMINATEKLAKVKYSYESHMAYHVISDHIRTCTFALSDGAMFSNEGRGYVLRRILRRAVRYGKKIGIEGSFLYNLVDVVVDTMKDFYPYLLERKENVKKFIKLEEEKFEKTLDSGESMLNSIISNGNKLLSGKDAFKLYDTYGFPFELTKEICLENNIEIDEEEFKKEMNAQKERARESRKKENSMHSQSFDLLSFNENSEFSYDTSDIKTKVIGLFKDGNIVDSINDEGYIVLEKTNFYAESGGEVGDSGTLEFKDGIVNVEDTIKAPNKQHLHYVVTNGITINVNDELTTHINVQRRTNISRNHSAVHILQKVLQETLGDHIKQAGSYVDEYRLRFDFTHFEKIDNKVLEDIENKVNEIINKGLPSTIKLMNKEEAIKTGAMALFNEKYGDVVRVVNFDNYSIEFCGGCHVTNTSNIGCFVILSEESISSGVRRIEATTSFNAYKELKAKEDILNSVSNSVGSTINEVVNKTNSLINELDQAKEALKKIEDDLIDNKVNELINTNNSNECIKIVEVFENANKNLSLKLVDKLKSLNKDYFVYIINKSNDKLALFAACSSSLVNKGIHCGKIIQETSKLANGNGGGSPFMAQAGGRDISKVNDILNYIKENVK